MDIEDGRVCEHARVIKSMRSTAKCRPEFEVPAPGHGKAAQLEPGMSWENVARHAMSAQDEWRQECAAMKLTAPKMEELKLPTNLVKEILQTMREKTVTTAEKECQTEVTAAAIEARLNEEDDSVDELRAEAAERETAHKATIRMLEKKLRQMHRGTQGQRSLVANMQNEILRRDKALVRLLKESALFRDS
ncbi:hypothetical protein IQ06DRAFT_293713, partial [Phaeosphaeriaceae sp. SRC1lsM3a]